MPLLKRRRCMGGREWRCGLSLTASTLPGLGQFLFQFQRPIHPDHRTDCAKLLANPDRSRPLPQSDSIDHSIELPEQVVTRRVSRATEIRPGAPQFRGEQRPSVKMIQEPVRLRAGETGMQAEVGAVPFRCGLRGHIWSSFRYSRLAQQPALSRARYLLSPR